MQGNNKVRYEATSNWSRRAFSELTKLLVGQGSGFYVLDATVQVNNSSEYTAGRGRVLWCYPGRFAVSVRRPRMRSAMRLAFKPRAGSEAEPRMQRSLGGGTKGNDGTVERLPHGPELLESWPGPRALWPLRHPAPPPSGRGARGSGPGEDQEGDGRDDPLQGRGPLGTWCG